MRFIVNLLTLINSKSEFKTAQKGTICGDKFSDQSANVICRELGFRGAENWTSGEQYWPSIRNNYEPILFDVDCGRSSFTFGECSYKNESSTNCSKGQALHLSCSSNNGMGMFISS